MKNTVTIHMKISIYLKEFNQKRISFTCKKMNGFLDSQQFSKILLEEF
jgi:hypothetical protein